MKARTFATTLAVSAAALGTMGAGSAFAATLYTTSAHTTPVAVGATAVGTSGTVTLYSGKSIVNKCTSSSLDLTLNQNSGGTVSASVTGGSFNGCNLATTINAPWTPGLSVTGSGTVVGANTTWAATVGGVSVNFAGGQYTGNLSTHVVASESTSKGAPLTLKLTKAGTLTGPLTSDGLVTATYKFTGAAAKYSLGN